MMIMTSLHCIILNRMMKFEQQYSIAVQKKAMDVEELALQELQEMLPTCTPSPYGFDVRA